MPVAVAMTLAFFALAYWGLVIRNSMRRTHEQLGAQHWERIALSRQSLDVWLSLMLGAFLLVEVLLESVTAFAIAVSILLAACLARHSQCAAGEHRTRRGVRRPPSGQEVSAIGS